MLRLSELKALEKEANTMAANDDCTAGAIRKHQLAIQYKTGRFEADFKAFMDDHGIRPGTHLVEICQVFFLKGKRDLSL
jgi:hypothetical protein